MALQTTRTPARNCLACFEALMQRLILPYKTAVYLPLGFAAVTTSAMYLIPAETAVASEVALTLSAVGGVLLGFALARLVVGVAIVRTSGLWQASRRAWLLGALAIAAVSLASGAKAVANLLDAATVV